MSGYTVHCTIVALSLRVFFSRSIAPRTKEHVAIVCVECVVQGSKIYSFLHSVKIVFPLRLTYFEVCFSNIHSLRLSARLASGFASTRAMLGTCSSLYDGNLELIRILDSRIPVSISVAASGEGVEEKGVFSLESTIFYNTRSNSKS